MNEKNRQSPVPLDEFTARFPTVRSRAASAARLCLGNGREQLVEEIVNDALLLLWKRQRDGKLPEKPESWVYTVAWRRALRYARVEGRYVGGLVEQVDGTEGANPGLLLMPPDEVTPVVGAEFTDRLAAVKKLLEAFNSAATTYLNDDERLLFELLYKQRLTGDEAARHLGVTPEAVRQQWSRLLTKLLGVVRLELQKDSLCNELLSTVLSNERTFRRSLLQLLRFVMRRGVEELERLVQGSMNN